MSVSKQHLEFLIDLAYKRTHMEERQAIIDTAAMLGQKFMPETFDWGKFRRYVRKKSEEQ